VGSGEVWGGGWLVRLQQIFRRVDGGNRISRNALEGFVGLGATLFASFDDKLPCPVGQLVCVDDEVQPSPGRIDLSGSD
jgi:hypothetical protein